ncbi:MAG: 1-acyl-sn-glycerol-3-phosphate acyltransferase [Bacteroidales bacterium]
MQKFCRFIMNLFGWKSDGPVPPEDKSICIAFPHTSIMDFIWGWIHYAAEGGTPNVLIKKEFFFWPLGWVLKKMGAIPVNQAKGTSAIKETIRIFETNKRVHLFITPEGTRKKTSKWKTGFHYIARKTGTPLRLGYIDYKKKTVFIKGIFELTDDVNEDIKNIKAWYKKEGATGKYKDKYTFD